MFKWIFVGYYLKNGIKRKIYVNVVHKEKEIHRHLKFIINEIKEKTGKPVVFVEYSEI